MKALRILAEVLRAALAVVEAMIKVGELRAP
jgi:hypothetical protein